MITSWMFEFPALLRSCIGRVGDRKDLINSHYGLSVISVYEIVLSPSYQILRPEGVLEYYLKTCCSRNCTLEIYGEDRSFNVMNTEIIISYWSTFSVTVKRFSN